MEASVKLLRDIIVTFVERRTGKGADGVLRGTGVFKKEMHREITGVLFYLVKLSVHAKDNNGAG